MLKNVAKYKAAATVALEAAGQALTEGKMDEYATHKAAAESALATAKAWQSQVDAAAELDGLATEPAPAKSAPAADRLPHTAEAGDVSKTASEYVPAAADTQEGIGSVVKSVNTLRYGDTSKAIDVVVADMYGKDYQQKRYDQQVAFNTYLKSGRLSAKQEASLLEIIYTPDLVAQEIKSGFSVQEMETNKAVQQSGALELGGYLVPEDFRTEITKRIAEPTIVRSRARVISTTRDAVEWTSLIGGDSRHTSGVRVTWVEELPSDAEGAATNFELGTIRIPVHTVMARIDVSRNLLEDSITPVPALINEQFAEAIALDEDQHFLLGTGGGSPKGILSKRESGLYAPGDGIGYVYTGNATELTGDGLIDLAYETDMQYWSNLQLVGNKNAFRDARKLKTTDGQYIWQPGLQAGDPGSMLGYKWSMTTMMDNVAAGTYPILIGDFRGYVIADRVGMTIERVTDATTTGQNKVAFFLRRRTGGQVVEPWRFKALKVGVAPA